MKSWDENERLVFPHAVAIDVPVCDVALCLSHNKKVVMSYI